MSLLEAVGTALDKFQQELSVFSRLLRKTLSEPGEAEIPSQVIAALDPVFAADKELLDHLKKINEFQTLQAAYERLKSTLDSKAIEADNLIEEFFYHILVSKQELEREEHRLEKMLAMAKSGGLPVDSFIAFTERISLSSGPPDGWTSEEPLYLHRPPYPTEDLLRASLLFQVMNGRASVNAIAVDASMHPEHKSALEATPNETAGSHEPSLLDLDLDLNPDLL